MDQYIVLIVHRHRLLIVTECNDIGEISSLSIVGEACQWLTRVNVEQKKNRGPTKC